MKKSIKYLFLLCICATSLTSCTIYPSNYVGFKMRNTGEFAQSFNIAYIYDEAKYTKEDDITLDVYFGHEKGRGDAYGDVCLFITISDYFYLDSNCEQYENEEYKSYDDKIYFIDEVEKSLFNSEEYEYTFHAAEGFYLGCEFNHHQIIHLSKNLKEYMFNSSYVYFHLADIHYYPESDWVYFDELAEQKISYKVKDDKLSFI